MKHENAEFLTALNRRKAARRRTVSLLLVLSMLVSSGVSWALHGIGMTMVNEPETEAESSPKDGTKTEELAESGEDTGADSAEPGEAEAPDETDAESAFKITHRHSRKRILSLCFTTAPATPLRLPAP